MREVRRWERARLRLKFEELVFKEEIVWGQKEKVDWERDVMPNCFMKW